MVPSSTKYQVPSKQAIAQIRQDIQIDSNGRGFKGEKSKGCQMSEVSAKIRKGWGEIGFEIGSDRIRDSE